MDGGGVDCAVSGAVSAMRCGSASSACTGRGSLQEEWSDPTLTESGRVRTSGVDKDAQRRFHFSK